MKKQITSIIVLTLFSYSQGVVAGIKINSEPTIKNASYSVRHSTKMDKTPEESTSTGSSPDKNVDFSFSVEFAKKEIEKELNEINTALIRRHRFGEGIARRLYLFNEIYTYESSAPGAFSSRQIIEKPVIYNTINKIEKYYKKEVRKDRIAKDNATDDFKNILEKALLLYYEDTEKLETVLSDQKSIKQKIILFNNISLD